MVHSGGRARGIRSGGLAVTALVASTALLTAACGSATPAADRGGAAHPTTPRAVVLASVQQTEAVDTAAVSLHVSVAGTPSIAGLVPAASGTGAAPVSLTISGQGAFDFRAHQGEMTVTFPAGKDSTGGTLQIRILGHDLYFSAPQLAGLDGGKAWVHVDAGAYVQKEGQSAGPLSGFSDGDPTQVLGMLQQISGAVTEVGTANVDGVPTTEYQGTIDLTGRSGAAGSPSGAGGGATGSTVVSPQIAQALGLTDIPVDVWVDGAGRARRVQTSFAFFGITVSAQEGFGSFGAPVSVSAPPAGDVADGSSLLDSGQLDNLFGNSSSS